ncbi:Rab family GTPase [Scytonema millei]|uniref:GTP-binding protein n=1 Tax=Scytonema millei VB511283 TaxID=1245923 RepID=A0A9X5E126_9CYAN|nr:Rab family GTPase [Scytonema millei]NHC33486.1 GTP-binding protein [Scytonema millei VB511283]
MIQKKVCMVGAFATGKTSLVSQFVKSIYSEIYHSTVGVKIDKKLVKIADREVNLILWDIHGEDEFQKLQMSYLRGASGYLLVVDGTRRYTLDKALSLQQRVEETLGKVPFILVLNKSDLTADWEIEDSVVDSLLQKNWTAIETSAKTATGVEEAFAKLTQQMLEAMDVSPP